MIRMITDIKLKILNRNHHSLMLEYLKDREGYYQSNGDYVIYSNLDKESASWIKSLIIYGVYGVPEEWISIYPELKIWVDNEKWDDKEKVKYYCIGDE